MKKIAIAVVVIIIIGLAAYFGYANYYSSAPTPSPTSSPTTTTTPTTQPSPTSTPISIPTSTPTTEPQPTPTSTTTPKPTPTNPFALDSGIRGTVLLGPTCPVERIPPDPACAEKKFATRLAVTTTDYVTTITEFSSEVNGTFSIGLPPGEYAIRSAVAANVLPYCSSDGIITVKSGSYTQATIRCDTGIR